MNPAIAAAPAAPNEADPVARDAARPTVAFIGAGRCATALAIAVARAGYRVVAVHSRTAAHARRLAVVTGADAAPTALAAVRRADVTFLTVPDAAITRVGATLAASGAALRGRSLVHCSGAMGRDALASARQAGASVGAVHPLMALTDANSAEALAGAFFAVDADPGLAPALERMVADVGGVPFAAPAGDRALYHAAAALAGNAPLALLATASRLLERAGVDAQIAGDALATLLEGAARNARRLGARQALTGPVVRNDVTTVSRHLEALRTDPASHHLYVSVAAETLRTVGVTGREAVAELLGRQASGATPPSWRRRTKPVTATAPALERRLTAA